jgi:hypothetical protein
MEANPEGSETIVTTPEPGPEPDPVVEFKKGKTKREAKRKEVKVITEYVPEPEPKSDDVESIAARVADMLFAKMAVEKNEIPPTKKSKTKAKPRAAAKKEEESVPPTKYFGWC